MSAIGSLFNKGLHLFGNTADVIDKKLGLGQPDAAPAENPQPAPVVTPPPVMPVPDDEAMAQARKRSIAEQTKRRGRASTILTSGPGGDTLGAG